MDDSDVPELSDAMRASFAPILKAIGEVRVELSDVNDVVVVRPGFKYPPDGPPLPAVVVAVTPGTTPVKEADLQTKFGVAFAVTEATVEEQVTAAHRKPVSFGTPAGSTAGAFEKMLSGDAPVDFAPPKSGGYKQPNPPNLPLVKEPMELAICVSPEAGWSELEAFLGETKSSLTVAMYQFTAPHIFEAIEKAVTPGARKFELILHPVPEKPAKTGVKAHDLDEEEAVIEPLERSMKKRFEQTWATLVSKKNPEGPVCLGLSHQGRGARRQRLLALERQLAVVEPAERASVRRRCRKSCRPASSASTTATITPIIKNDKLASIYEFYIKRDFELSAAQAADFAAPEISLPSPTFSCPRRAEAPVAFAKPPQVLQAAAAEPRSQRSAAADAGQLCGERAKLIKSAQEERLVPEPVHQLPRHRARTSPNSACWSARSRTRSTRSSTCASSAAT